MAAYGLAWREGWIRAVVSGCLAALWLSRPADAGAQQARESDAGAADAGAADAGVIDVTVRGATVAEKMEQSSEAVRVTDLTLGRRQSADMGELLARAGAVGVLRQGGLGSEQRLLLGGFEGDQVRVFVDGLPIEFAGYGPILANLPTSLMARAEIYRGVVPVRFGANALGGAINIVTRQPARGTGGHGSLQLGSFGTTRAAVGAHHLHAPSGLLVRANGYLDDAKNDYPVRVALGNADGGTSYAKVYRKHDAYRAGGAGFDIGFVRRPWAEKLMLRTFASAFRNQAQSDLVMTQPYGKVHYGGESYGSTLEYLQRLSEPVRVELLAGYGYAERYFVDTSPFKYDWFGRAVRPSPKTGEVGTVPYDQRIREHGAFARLQLVWTLSGQHDVRFSSAPSYTTRTGHDYTVKPPELDALASERRLLSWVNAVEYTLKLFDERLENVLFGKSYLYLARAHEPLASGYWRDRSRDDHRFGFGDSVRLVVTEWLSFKAGYELATRLPRPDEVFGDGNRVKANLELRPEYSHNSNYGAVIAMSSRVGDFKAEVHGFDRRASQLIALIGSIDFAMYSNLYTAHGRGAEALGSWSAPGGWLTLDGNVSYQSLRNESTRGQFAAFRGDRIPNRPYLFANASGRLRAPRVVGDQDELSLGYYLRYVHSFYRFWESGGGGAAKQTVEGQLAHALVLTYLTKLGSRTFSYALEAQNLTDARLYDNFGAQRPGRAFYAKLTAEL